MVDMAISSSADDSPGLTAQLPPAVSLTGITFAWPSGEPVLDDFSLELKACGKLLITGASGSGKSTLLSLMSGILKPQKGTVSIVGKEISSLSNFKRDRFRGDNIGYIFQQFNLVPYLSSLENVLIPLRFSSLRRKRVLQDNKGLSERAKELLERLSIGPSLWHRPASKLSVGQQQRVAAARALIGRPPLLIADEPTSALDKEIGLVFLRLLLKECEEASLSLVFVSHDESFASEFSQRLSLRRVETPLDS
ncbi:MAG: ABC transporter ATP-binding protein [Deltaproteobacteria bacterium]|jgi:putative ABC transport system ATP-binding protein|nr:ABC transporter ATP-binding protein [Deltaproteobacteria bacterium]